MAELEGGVKQNPKPRRVTWGMATIPSFRGAIKPKVPTAAPTGTKKKMPTGWVNAFERLEENLKESELPTDMVSGRTVRTRAARLKTASQPSQPTGTTATTAKKKTGAKSEAANRRTRATQKAKAAHARDPTAAAAKKAAQAPKTPKELDVAALMNNLSKISTASKGALEYYYIPNIPKAMQYLVEEIQSVRMREENEEAERRFQESMNMLVKANALAHRRFNELNAQADDLASMMQATTISGRPAPANDLASMMQATTISGRPAPARAADPARTPAGGSRRRR